MPSLPPSGPITAETDLSQLSLLRVPAWAGFDWLRHGFSTRTGGCSTVYAQEGNSSGELNLGFTASDSRENVLRNRERFVEAVAGDGERSGTAALRLVTLSQIHSALVKAVSGGDAAESACGEGDGMMTAEPGLLLAIQTADCIPVLVADTKRRAVAAFHAGWRGTVKRIVEQGVAGMKAEYGSRSEDMIAAIGPGIGGCCYAVGEEVFHGFREHFVYADELFRESGPEKTALHLDLIEANRRQLLDAGVSASAISMVGECTRCHPEKYFSYRASNGFTGRMFSAIGVV